MNIDQYFKLLNKFLFKSLILIVFLFFLANCSALKPNSKNKDVPINALERARKNVEEGRGVSLGGLLNNKNTNYEFSTSNPLWRASLEIVDFLPLSVVDYAGGIIVSDWYYDNNPNEFIKITIRFLSNDVRSDSLQVIVHQKKCSLNNNCKINLVNSKIKEELISSILKKAALLEKQKKK